MLLLLSLACHAPVAPFIPVAPPSGFLIHGIDVSVHQGWIDWPAVAASGEVHFVYLKASEGSSHVDKRFERNWRGARAEGLAVGAYHYWSACRSAEEQAAHFLAVLPADGLMLPPVLDVEVDARCNARERVDPVAVGTWLDLVEAARGVRPFVYSNDHLLQTRLQPLRAGRWAAAYSREPRSDWLFWQHTDRGAVAGVRGPVDRNVFRGTDEVLAALMR